MEEKIVEKTIRYPWYDSFMQGLFLVIMCGGVATWDMIKRNDNPFTGLPIYMFLGALVAAIERYVRKQRKGE